MESFVFIIKYSGQTSTNSDGSARYIAKEVWDSSVKDLLERSPNNVHYFFASYDSTYSNDVSSMESRVNTALNQMPLNQQEIDDWNSRLHFITQSPSSFSGALGDRIQSSSNFWIGIDCMQRWKEIQYLHDPVDSDWLMKHIANEALSYKYELDLNKSISSLGADEVLLWQNYRHSGGWGSGANSYIDANFSSLGNITLYDSFGILMYHWCTDHSSSECNAWDRTARMYVCDVGDNSTCDSEMARWITTYRREGLWFTDLSPYMWMLNSQENFRFRYQSNEGVWMDAKFLFWNSSIPDVPMNGSYLWSGKQFNERDSFEFTIPQGVSRIKIAALITGHGSATTSENCAEFCNHQHEWNINGQTHMKHHPTAGTTYGCADQVLQGVSPNQGGTWWYGRAGWCPGMDVKLYVLDITANLVIGLNNLSYRGLYNGADYSPTYTGQGDYNPEIIMSSWIIYYRNSTNNTVFTTSNDVMSYIPNLNPSQNYVLIDGSLGHNYRIFQAEFRNQFLQFVNFEREQDLLTYSEEC